MNTFPHDHPVEALRGRPIPEPHEVRRELLTRIAWLKHRIEMAAIEGRKPVRDVGELAALTMLRAMHDQAYPPDSTPDTEPPPAPEAPT